MNKSILGIGIVILVLFTGFYFNSNDNYANLCMGDFDCVSKVILETNDSNLCKSLENPSQCYFIMSYELKNPNLCDKTIDKSYCYENNAVLLENVDLCKFVKNEDNCVFQVSIKTNDYKVCELGLDSELCYYSYAVYSQNESLCEFAKNYSESCMSKIVG